MNSVMTRQYLETILWAETDSNGESLDRNYSIDDFDPELVGAVEHEMDELYDYAIYARWAIALGVPVGMLEQEGAVQVLEDQALEVGLELEEMNWDSTDLAHDFWLTRNGHGTGFWDKPEKYGEELAAALTKYAKKAGEQHPYVGDDGRIYVS